MGENRGKTPGLYLQGFGLMLTIVGGAFAILTIARTDLALTSRGFEQVWVGPSPFAWLLLVVGLGLMAAAWAKRILAALESAKKMEGAPRT